MPASQTNLSGAFSYTMVGFMDMPGMTTRTGVAFLEVGAEFAGGGLDAFEVRGVPFGEFGQVEEYHTARTRAGDAAISRGAAAAL